MDGAGLRHGAHVCRPAEQSEAIPPQHLGPPLAVPNVSTIHDHPWDFESHDRGRRLRQPTVRDAAAAEYGCPTHSYTTIKTGEGGGMEKAPIRTTALRAGRPELYEEPAMSIRRSPTRCTRASRRGTITINDARESAIREHARVFWPIGTNWVDAEPREATFREVCDGIRVFTERWF
jgi:hypothetical protein